MLLEELDNIEMLSLETESERAPALGESQPIQSEHMRIAVGHCLQVGLTLIIDDRSLNTAELTELRSAGSECARQGIALGEIPGAIYEALHHLYPTYHSATQRCAPDREPQTSFVALSDALHGHIAKMLAAIAVGYETEVAAQHEVHAQHRADAVGFLLERRLGPDEQLGNLDSVDRVFDTPFVLVLTFGLGSAALSSLAAIVERQFPGAIPAHFMAEPIAHRPIVVPGTAVRSWRELLTTFRQLATDFDCTVLVERIPSANELAPTYGWVRSSLPVAAAATPRKQVVEGVDLVPWACVGTASVDTDFYLVRRVLGEAMALEPGIGRRLLESHAALVAAHGSVPKAARIVGVDPRTLRRRLRQLQELTGFDPQALDDAVILTQCCRLLAFRRDKFPCEGDARWSLKGSAPSLVGDSCD